jgi:protein SCO1/2
MRALRIAAIVVLAILLGPGAPRAAEEQKAAMDSAAARRYFTDVQLVNQNGDTMRLYSDLIDGKVVIINTFFASCTGSCPVMAGSFAEIQKHLGDRVGKDVYLISISVDPTEDTPAKLKEYASRFHARPGWYFLTGTKANVELALRKLGQYVEDRNNHFNVIIIGNQRTGLWKKAFGLAKPGDLFPIVDSVVNDKG